jgi:hypothetical protein
LGEGGGDEICGGGWIYFITTDLGCIGDGDGETTNEENHGSSTDNDEDSNHRQGLSHERH